ARLLYGGRNSLLIGVAAALLTCIVATVVGLVAGFFGGVVDGVLSRLLDVVWAFPVYLLAISLSTVLIARGFSWGPFHLESGSLLLPIAIIGVVYIPYVARPIRGEVLSLRRKEFVEAAIGLGASTWRSVRKDFGLDRPLPVQYGLMMKKLFITRDLTSFVNRGAKVIPQVTEAAPVTLSLVLGAAVIWVVFSIGMGLVSFVVPATT